MLIENSCINELYLRQNSIKSDGGVKLLTGIIKNAEMGSHINVFDIS